MADYSLANEKCKLEASAGASLTVTASNASRTYGRTNPVFGERDHWFAEFRQHRGNLHLQRDQR